METLFGQTLALRLGDGNENHPLESDMTGQIVKGNHYLLLLVTFTYPSLFPLSTSLAGGGGFKSTQCWKTDVLNYLMGLHDKKNSLLSEK